MTRALPSLRDTQTLAKWLMTTTHRECWRLSRRRTATLDAAETPELASQHAPEESMLAWERQHRVHAALEKLGGRCEKLLRLVFLDKTSPSYEEIGSRLGMPVGSIGPIRARCLAKLTEELEDLR